MTDQLVWASLDTLASGYERMHGHRPDRMIVGRLVAESLEPDHGPHPLHLAWRSPTPGVWLPAPPPFTLPGENWWQRRRRLSACRAQGGHWWHPADAMITWFCCVCGSDRDGVPPDGT